jgi:hypothetical protein
MTDGSFLVVEIKGQEGDAAIKKAAGERWCKAVTNDGRFGNWAYIICWEANEIRTGWILGFMSAFNQYGLQSEGADVSEGKNTDELMGWVDNYCSQHQGDDLHTASEAFIDDFRQRTRR